MHKCKFILKLFIAPIIASIIIIFLYLILGESFWLLGGFMTAYFFPPLGKESVIPMAIAAGIHPILIASVVAFLDIIVALFLLWNYDLIKHIPLLGNWVKRIEAKGEQITTKRPWIKKFETITIMLFVMFPLQGSGGVGATILGRLLGMNKYLVFIAISIATFIGCLMIAYASILIKSYSVSLLIIIIVAIIIIVIINKWRLKCAK